MKFTVLYLLSLIQLINSFHQCHINNHELKKYAKNCNVNNNYNSNDIPLTFQSKLSTSTLISAAKMSIILSSLRLILPNQVNAAVVDITKLSECSDSIVVLKGPNLKDIIMIGTAHISEDSANLVRRTIRSIRPDLVMIELDLKRIGKFDDDNKLREAGFLLPSSNSTVDNNSNVIASTTSTSSIIINKEKKQIIGFKSMISGLVSKLGGLLLGKALGNFYSSIEKLGFTAGGEFKAAIEEGQFIGSKILLGDRDVEITLQRLAKAISMTDSENFTRLGDKIEKLQESFGITDLDNLIDDKQSALSTIERMKQRDTLNTILSVVHDEVPLIYGALIGERDEYMANSIVNAKGNIALGVVGMAHMNGIEKYLTQKGYTIVKRNCPKML